MISFGSYYFINASDISFIEYGEEENDNNYPYFIKITTKAGQSLQINYMAEEDRNADLYDLNEQIITFESRNSVNGSDKNDRV